LYTADADGDESSKNDRIWNALEDFDAETAEAVGHCIMIETFTWHPWLCAWRPSKPSIQLAVALLEDAALQTLYEDPRNFVASIATRIVQMVLENEDGTGR
jgi:hypothetical protein